MSHNELPEPLVQAGFSTEQKEYLTGMFAGIAIRGTRFSDVEASPVAAKAEDLIFEERVKRELHPLDAYEQLEENARGNKAPDKEEIFRFKWNGLFFLSPVKDAYMARLRIPGGLVKSFQLRELAHIASELTTGYVQITTRSNFQMRLIAPKDTPEFLHRVQSVGLHTRGAGADNIRNLTANPTAGVDPVELTDTMPLIQALGRIIINDRAFYDLPRKFNIAYDGGGLIGSVEDTNDIGVKAVMVGKRVMFRIALGGATGHKAFAKDLGIVVGPEEINKVVAAIVRVFIEKGNRSDRKKARLKHLLEKMSLEDYLKLVEAKLGKTLERSPYDPATMRWASHELPHSHVGVYSQKQRGLSFVGVAIPVGQITPKQMLKVAELAETYGSSEVRLTVWQNFIIPNVKLESVKDLVRALEKIGLSTQHYMGDIGCLGTKAKIAGESVDGYHIFVGGGFGKHQAVGRQVFSGVPATDLPKTLETILKAYLENRQGRESFQQFTTRNDLNQLQVLFSRTK